MAGLIGCGGGRFSGPSGAAGITLSGVAAELQAGTETLARADVTDFSGRPLPDAAVTWESSDPEAVIPIPVDTMGRSARIVAGQKNGPVTLTARAGAQTATLSLTVTGAKPPPISFARDIQPIFTRSCAIPDCHSGDEEFVSGGILLEEGRSYSQSVGVPALQVRNGSVLRVEPGNPDRSYLVAKIRGTHRALGGSGAQMPLDGSLPAEDLQKILRWVEEGAPNN